MEVLSYQLFFILFIPFISLFGKTIRNWVVFISFAFTIFAIFTSGLMALQLVSISIGFLISESIISKMEENKEATDSCVGVGCALVFVVFIVFYVLLFVKDIFFENKKDVKVKPKTIIENIKTPEKDNTKPKTKNIYTQTNNNQIEIIKKYIIAENNRDINELNYYLSDNPKKFWNIENPTKNEINNLYYQNWSKNEYTNTQILEIRKTDFYYYIDVNFNYGNNSTHNVIIFTFDEYDKIIEIY